MKTTLPRNLAVALFCSAGIFSGKAAAATFDFSTSDQYTNNFKNTFVTSGSSNVLSATGGAISHTATGSGTAISAYDTTPDTTATNFFTDVTVEFDFSTTVFNTSFGVFFGGTNRTNANLALFNLNNNSLNDQLRIFGAKDWNLATGVNGNTASPSASVTLNSTSTSSPVNNGWTINKTYHAVFSVTYTSATTANVTYTISDPSSGLASVSITANGLNLAGTGGEIGLRTGFSAGGGTMLIDNVQIYTSAIPEPSTAALLGGLGVLGLAATARRRRT